MGLRIFFDRHPESAVASTGSAIELLEVLWRQKLAVGIVELSDQSACRLFIDGGERQRVDVPIADEAHHLFQKRSAFALPPRLQQEAASDHRDEECADQRGFTSAWHANVQRDCT